MLFPSIKYKIKTKILTDDIVRYILSDFLLEKDIFNLIIAYDRNKYIMNMINDPTFFLNYNIKLKKDNIFKSRKLIYNNSYDANFFDKYFNIATSIRVGFIEFDILIQFNKLEKLFIDEPLEEEKLAIILEKNQNLTHLEIYLYDYSNLNDNDSNSDIVFNGENELNDNNNSMEGKLFTSENYPKLFPVMMKFKKLI